MPDIFVSYAREDADRIRHLVAALSRERAWTFWWDARLRAGSAFDEAILAQLEKAACVIVAWSRHGRASRWVKDEAGVGLKRGVLVPVSLDGSEPPLGFRSLHVRDLSAWHGDSRAGLSDLIEDIENVLKEEHKGLGGDPAAGPGGRRPHNLWIGAVAAAGTLVLSSAALIAYRTTLAERSNGPDAGEDVSAPAWGATVGSGTGITAPGASPPPTIPPVSTNPPEADAVAIPPPSPTRPADHPMKHLQPPVDHTTLSDAARAALDGLEAEIKNTKDRQITECLSIDGASATRDGCLRAYDEKIRTLQEQSRALRGHR